MAMTAEEQAWFLKSLRLPPRVFVVGDNDTFEVCHETVNADSWEREAAITITRKFTVRRWMGQRELAAVLHEAVRNILSHEADEWLAHNGQRLFLPHASPFRSWRQRRQVLGRCRVRTVIHGLMGLLMGLIVTGWIVAGVALGPVALAWLLSGAPKP